MCEEDQKMASHDAAAASSPYMSVSEAATYLGVGRKIVYQPLDFGQIRAVRKKGGRSHRKGQRRPVQV
jgi:excisionase family DNA binding protein